MTVKLSRLKANKIIRLYFRGLTQGSIAEKTAVNQSSISHYSSRFKEIAKTKGLLNTGKEFGVENEIEALRSLAVEMADAGLTSEEAKIGLKIYKAFLKLEVSPDQHQNLIKVCSKINNQDFVHAAVKFTEIEDELELDDDTGVISGTPTTAGDYEFTVQVEDESEPVQSDTQELSISITD